jgi:UDP-N-acetylglucosamine 2-epimerase
MAVKVLTIVGTRPEIIKLSLVLAEIERYTEHTLVHTGQNYDYELNQIFFDELGVRAPDIYLQCAEGTVANTIGNIIARSDEVMAKLKPDALLVYGDTNSCLSVIPAKRRKIPIFHMEAGNRCFDLRVPEEINRRIVDHTADINMTITEHARRYLVEEGIRPETIIKVGSSMTEVCRHFEQQIDKSAVLSRLGLQPKGYVVVSAHREENVDDEEVFVALMDSINMVAEHFSMPLVFSVHPRTAKRIAAQGVVFHEKVSLLKPLGFLDYMKLQTHSFCVVSDSGTITEESSILGFPAVTIRNTHERPEGMDVGTLVMTGVDARSVIEGIRLVTDQSSRGYRTRIVPDYEPADVSKKVVRVILSYIGYVRRTTWRMAT